MLLFRNFVSFYPKPWVADRKNTAGILTGLFAVSGQRSARSSAGIPTGWVYARLVAGPGLMADHAMEQDFSTLPNARLIQEAFVNTFDSIIITEANLEPPGPRIVYVNRRFTEMTGYLATEVIGRTPRILQGPRSDKAVIKYMGRRLRSGQGFFGEIINYRKDGTPFFLEWRIVPVRDGQGEILNWVAIQRDTTRSQRTQREMTRLNQELEHRVLRRTRDLSETNQRLRQEVAEHRRTETRLRESEQRFRLLVEAVTDYAIFMLDTDGHVASWNAGAQRFKGYTTEEILGQHFSRFYLPEDVAQGLPEKALRCAKMVGRFEVNGWRVRKDGRRFWAHVVIDPIHDETDTLIGYAKITRDVTKQRESQQALARTMEQLLQSNASLEQFAYAASHDLKAPLRNIFSFIQLLEEECRGRHSPEVDDYLKFIRQNADQMYALVDDVLEYSRVRADQGSRSPVDLNGIMERLTNTLHEAINSSDAQIQCTTLPVVMGHEPLLIQLFQNLLSNALKFQPAGQQPHIRIHGETTDEGWRIVVSDNGIGVEKAHQERIFQLFQRLHRAAEYPGTGIGLAICKQVVEHHGGTICLDSAPGEGSTFTIYLPETPGGTESDGAP